MKRHQSLVGLSREHHHALVLARQLHSESPAPFRAKLPASADARIQLVRERFESELEPHFQAEEAHLVRRFAAHPDLAEVGEEIMRQHAAIRALVAKLELGAGLSDAFDALSAAITAHVRFEERTWFPAIEAQASDAELIGAGAALGAH